MTIETFLRNLVKRRQASWLICLVFTVDRQKGPTKRKGLWARCLSVPLEVGVSLFGLDNLHIMAPCLTSNLTSPHNEQDLSDEQVEALLKEAEDRLRLRRDDYGDSQSPALRKPYVSQLWQEVLHLLMLLGSQNSNMASKLQL